MITRFFTVADFTFEVSADDNLDIYAMLPSFASFATTPSEATGKELLFSFNTSTSPAEIEGTLVETSDNDMGVTRLFAMPDGYYVEMGFRDSAARHTMRTDSRFAMISAHIVADDIYAPVIFASMLRIAFSQAILLRQAVSIHASAVMLGDKAYAFMGPSGTGKSTHAQLWISRFEGCELMNDDNPIIRIVDGAPIIYGSPWSGKTPCYRNVSHPLAAVVRLEQHSCNAFVPKHDVEAFVALLPGCSAIRSSQQLADAMADTVAAIAERVKVGVMRCRPDTEAAEVCQKALVAND